MGEPVAGRIDSVRLLGRMTPKGAESMGLTRIARAFLNARMVRRRGATHVEGVQACD